MITRRPSFFPRRWTRCCWRRRLRTMPSRRWRRRWPARSAMRRKRVSRTCSVRRSAIATGSTGPAAQHAPTPISPRLKRRTPARSASRPARATPRSKRPRRPCLPRRILRASNRCSKAGPRPIRIPPEKQML